MNDKLHQIIEKTAGATDVPFPCSVGYIRNRDQAWGKGFEAPVHVGEGASRGNCFTIISLGGRGATSSSQEAVTACAQELVHRVNNFPTLLALATELDAEVESIRSLLKEAREDLALWHDRYTQNSVGGIEAAYCDGCSTCSLIASIDATLSAPSLTTGEGGMR